jgi:transposase
MQDAPAKPEPHEAPPLPDQVGACHALLLEQAKVIIAAQAARVEQNQEIAALEAYVKKLLHQLYGRHSERSKHDPDQPMFAFANEPAAHDALAEAAAAAEQLVEAVTVRRAAQKKKRVEPRSEKFPAHFPRYEVEVPPAPEQLECAEHGPKQLIGFDTTETLEFERPKFRVRVTKYAKYACPQAPACGVAQATRPASLVEGNRFDTSLAAEIITNKYAYHIRLYREQDQFAGSGWTPSRSTLLNLLVASASVVRPLVAHFLRLILADGGVGCDDTRVTLIVPPTPPPLDPDDPRSPRIHEVLSDAMDKKLPSVTARMWGYRGFDAPLNYFDFTVSRHRDGPDEILRDYRGLLLGDCYAGFNRIELRSDARIVRGACWAHARRKFVDIAVNYPQPSAVLLALMGQLFDIEARAKDWTAADRLALRRSEAVPILARIKSYLDSPALGDALPKSDLASAAGYLRNQWPWLERYTTDGRLPIDNNLTEQLMKQIAVGRKNWLFVGSVEGGDRAATLMSLVSSAIRNDLDVAAYVKDVLDQLLAGCTDYDALTPHVWKQTHPEAIRTYRADERRDAADRQTYHRAHRRLDRIQKLQAEAKAQANAAAKTAAPPPTAPPNAPPSA